MKKNLFGSITVAALLATPLVSMADTFFTDDFSNGSTTNASSIPGGTPTASHTSYDIAATKSTACNIAAHDLTLKLAAATSSGFHEAQALFTTNPVALVNSGDYIDLQVVFTNTGGTLLAGANNKSLIALGLYNSGTGGGANLNPPVAGALANSGLSDGTGSIYAAGNCASWLGFSAQICSNGTCRIQTRPIENGSLTYSGDQELLFNGASSGSYKNPGGTTVVTGPSTNLALTAGGVYTMELLIALTPTNTLSISNFLYAGAGTAGTVLYSQGTASTTNFISGTILGSFDGLAIGAFNSSSTGNNANPTMDITSILITGQSSPPPPPCIIAQPISVSVPVGGSAMFSISAGCGANMTYQWHRHGANLLNGGDISGATSSTLIIAPVASADFVSDYYVTVTGAGNFTTNSVNVSLSSRTAANLVWNGAGAGDGWDLATSADWLNGANPTVFNYGDNVTFDDTAVVNTVALNYSYLSPGSVAVNSQYPYKFQGSGSIAGLGSLLYEGSGRLTINNANSYSGGTIISNAGAYLYLGNLAGLGTGPVVFGQAGGQMEIVTAGGAASGINGDVVVADDFTIQLDGNGSYAGVFFGNLSGTAGKTLTFNPLYQTNFSRIRVYGADTVCNAKLALNGVDASGGSAVYVGTVLAPYNGNGSQTYNGIISGVGGLIQRANGTTILNGANTYSGGTTPSTGVIAFGADTVGAVTSGPIGTGPLFLAPELPNTTGSGTVLAWQGARTIANPFQYPSATNNQTLIIGGTNTLTFTGPITLNGNDNTTNYTTRIFQVTNTALTTFSGAISDAASGFGLTKTGSGVLALDNTETYTGPTSVSNGTLQVNGQLAAGAVTVATNAFLGGIGTILGPVTVQTGGALAPGDSIGTLTINNNLTLAGNLSIEVNKSASPTSDKVVVSGTLTNTGTGTVTVTNLGPALAPGDTFTLFNRAVANGGALSVTGANVIWNNKLAIDGTIEVQAVIATTPTNINYSLSGTNLTLSWPANYLGWFLQTNSMGVTTTNWFALPNSQTFTQVVINVNPAKTNVFYRLFRTLP